MKNLRDQGHGSTTPIYKQPFCYPIINHFLAINTPFGPQPVCIICNNTHNKHKP